MAALSLIYSPLTFNWWLTPDTNVIDTYEAVPVSREAQTLWLDGLCPDEVQRVESAVMAAATRLPVPTRSVIVDRRGISDPDAWDSVALWDGTGVPLLPDKVLAPDPIAERIRRSAPGLRKEDAGGGGLSLLVPRHDPAAWAVPSGGQGSPQAMFLAARYSSPWRLVTVERSRPSSRVHSSSSTWPLRIWGLRVTRAGAGVVGKRVATT